MRYFEYDNGDYVIAVGTGEGGAEIDEARYNAVLAAIQVKPPKTEDTDYRLSVGLVWEPYHVEPEPDEPTDEDKAEAYDILMGEAE